MANDKQTESKLPLPSKDNESKDNDTIVKATDLNRIQVLKSIDGPEGFVCDINTGICGPITQEKEEKQ